MADDFIDIDGFEDYGPAYGGHNFESYVVAGIHQGNLSVNGVDRPLISQSINRRWLSVFTAGGADSMIVVEGLNGTGCALAMASGSTVSSPFVTRSLPSNYARLKFGFANKVNLIGGRFGVELLDDGVVNLGVYIDNSGKINICRGTFRTASPTVLYTSSALILSNTRHWIEVDASIDDSAGAVELRLNGSVVTTLTGQDTKGGSNAYVNQMRVALYSTINSFNAGAVDDMYWRDNTGGTAPFLGDRTIDGLSITADDTQEFTRPASIVGDWYVGQTSSTDTPGANQLVLMPVTPDVGKTINSVSLFPQGTSAAAKFTGVIYSDNAGAPDSLLSSGSEVVGCSSDVVLTLPLSTPQALTASTQYWIGYITDTSIPVMQADLTSFQQRKSNTYSSGAPAGPLSGMTTGQDSLMMWGNCTGQTVNWKNISRNPPALASGAGYAYNQGGSVGDKDYFVLSDLPATPVSIDIVKVSVMARRSDAGARTMNIKMDSGGTESNGDNAGFTPATSFNWYDSKFTQDPNTSTAWTAAGVNAMKVGYEVAS